MAEFFEKLIYLLEDTTIFTFCASIGSGILVIQLLLYFFGFAESDNDYDSDAGEEKRFKILSLQTIGGFLMMFGWCAITCYKEFDFGISFSILLSLILGCCSVFVMNLIFKMAKKFQSSGSVCSLDDVIGKEALVYQRIPKGGVGKVSISFQHLTCEVDAISHGQEELPSFTWVQILKKKDDVTVVVIPIQK